MPLAALRNWPYLVCMGVRSWSRQVDRRAEEQWRRAYVGPLYITLALAFAVYGFLVADSGAAPLTFAVVWFVLGLVSLLARARDRK